jgi:hypothetical protein
MKIICLFVLQRDLLPEKNWETTLLLTDETRNHKSGTHCTPLTPEAQRECETLFWPKILKDFS